MTRANCLVCSEPFEVETRHGRRRKYCADKCRQKAWIDKIKAFAANAKQETETPAPLRTVEELETLAHVEVEMANYQVEIHERDLEIAQRQADLITEAESTGRAAWLYLSREEEEDQEAAKAFRQSKPDDAWLAFDD